MKKKPTAFEKLGAYAGIADSGGRQLSTDTGRRFRDLLARRDSDPPQPSEPATPGRQPSSTVQSSPSTRSK